jgi:glycosyltransferase involved in cell wall biosynthesis
MSTKPTIIHILPTLTDAIVCGGIKVHYQLSELERENGYDSYCTYFEVDHEFFKYSQWFSHDVYEIAYCQALYLMKTRRNTVVIGWEDLDYLYKCPVSNKISYIQGNALFDKNQKIPPDVFFWYTTNYNKEKIGIDGNIVSPYIDNSLYFNYNDNKFQNKTINCLVLKRKNGDVALSKLQNVMSDSLKEKIKFILWDDSLESMYAAMLRDADMVFLHSYPEGLNLIGLEAMFSGTLCIGFNGGGGSSYLNDDNSLIVPDGDYKGLADVLEKHFVSDFSHSYLNSKIQKGFEQRDNFNRQNTSLQLMKVLEKYNRKD